MIGTIDSQIIEILERNSRLSYAEIGRMISLSPSSVRERVQKLEDLKIIKSYTIKIDHSLIDKSLEVFILLKVFDGQLPRILQEINLFDEVRDVFRITGPYNIHMRVILRDQMHLQIFIDKLTKFGNPTTLLVLSEIKKM